MIAGIFPGQGSQHIGMGAELYAAYPAAKALFEEANSILGYNLTDIMFEGSAEALKQTDITQPAVFVHSVVAAKVLCPEGFDLLAGHSLGEFSALVVGGAVSFAAGLRLVALRAKAMQAACDVRPATMAAVLGMDSFQVAAVCDACTKDNPDEVVVAANYNAPGQVVISGTIAGVANAQKALTELGCKRVIILPVSGGFHSPLMKPAKEALATAIADTIFEPPTCPIYQNVTATATQEVAVIRQRLMDQLTAPVLWHQLVGNMCVAGATTFVECGTGKVLQGLVKKITPDVEVRGIS